MTREKKEKLPRKWSLYDDILGFQCFVWTGSKYSPPQEQRFKGYIFLLFESSLNLVFPQRDPLTFAPLGPVSPGWPLLPMEPRSPLEK